MPADTLRIDNIEFAVSDLARSRAFYGGVFGWTFKDYGPTYLEFTDGRMTGGFTHRQAASTRRAAGDPVRPGPGRDPGAPRCCRSGNHPAGLRLSRRPAVPFHRPRWIRTRRLVRRMTVPTASRQGLPTPRFGISRVSREE
jgi:catechol 2,3-dioxygenase-like lactoylglutathione lyase family enzyme